MYYNIVPLGGVFPFGNMYEKRDIYFCSCGCVGVAAGFGVCVVGGVAVGCGVTSGAGVAVEGVAGGVAEG